MNNEFIYFKCPHCHETIQVAINEINCGIFRHAVFVNMEGVDPHLSESQCLELVASGKVLGCCKPFQITKHKGSDDNNTYYIIDKCDYV